VAGDRLTDSYEDSRTAATYLPDGGDGAVIHMNAGDDASSRPVAAVAAVGRVLHDRSTVPEVARTAVRRIRETLPAAGVALCSDGEYAASDGTIPATPPTSTDRTGRVAAGVGAIDAARVSPVGDWGTLWLWCDDDPGPATAAALGDRIAAAVARVRGERERERAGERIETVASVVNHDLHNPLSIADGYLEAARREENADHLEAVEGALGRIERVSEAAVTIARAGRPVESPRPVPLDGIAHEAWETVEPAVDGDARLVTGGGALSADPGRVLTLFERLFDNAVRHGDAGTVRVRATDEAVIVADDGPGIPPDRRDRATEPGYSTADGRTGLGLAVVEWLADAHGWSVSLRESEAGGLAVVLDGVEISEPSA
jgi:signal transduction histidine kinase